MLTKSRHATSKTSLIWWLQLATHSNTKLCNAGEVNTIPCRQKGLLRRKLLQFSKCHRPAFYGVWPKKSQVVGERHPFAMDPYLDYEVVNDEEWEEEEPGESLLDCDKDNTECLEEECSRDEDEDESEDGFFVLDGYLLEEEVSEEYRLVSVILYLTLHLIDSCWRPSTSTY